MKKQVLLFLLLCIGTNLYSQTNDTNLSNYEDRPTSIGEVVAQLGRDSFVFYYNDRYQLVKPKCLTLFRIAKIDSALSFFAGEFTDYYPDSIIAASGNYTNREKDGTFQFFYPNGQLEKTGNYAQDNKVGNWNYYYEDGSRHQVLEFQENNIYIKEFWDEKGKHLVENGNGDWFGYLTQSQYIRISGKVLKGRRVGLWEKDIPSQNFVMSLENFLNGKFTNGNSNSLMYGTKPYSDTSYCTIEEPEIFLKGEVFEMNQCFQKPEDKWVFAKYPGGKNKFNKELRARFLATNKIDFKGTLRIQTTINPEGKMTDFKPISHLGFENDLIEVLKTMPGWRPTKIRGKAVSQIKFIYLET